MSENYCHVSAFPPEKRGDCLWGPQGESPRSAVSGIFRRGERPADRQLPHNAGSAPRKRSADDRRSGARGASELMFDEREADSGRNEPSSGQHGHSSHEQESSFSEDIERELSALKKQGRHRFLRRVSGAQDAEIVIEGRKLFNFSSNNYLGLSSHPEVVEAFQKYACLYGVGAGASRLIGGNMDIHAELEDAFARFKGSEAALVFSSGYLANIGILNVLGSPAATIFSDELNHASIID